MPSSSRQQRAAALFPQRHRHHQQLALSYGRGALARDCCAACGRRLSENGLCGACNAFPCTGCGRHTTANGGDGELCYGCLLQQGAKPVARPSLPIEAESIEPLRCSCGDELVMLADLTWRCLQCAPSTVLTARQAYGF